MSYLPRLALLAAASLTAGCMTLPDAAAVGDDSVRLLVGESEAQLREMVAQLSAPASLDSSTAAAAAADKAAASLDAARLSLLARAANRASEPGLLATTDLAVIGVTLSICRESLRKIDRRMATDWDAAGRLAHGELEFLCLVPLETLGGL